MPAFVFVSGYLYSFNLLGGGGGKFKNNKKFIEGKCKRLLLPYLIWGVFLLLIMPQRYELSMMFQGISHLWFLLMLLGVFLVAHFTKNWWKTYTWKQDVLAIAVLYALYLAYKYSHLPSILCFIKIVQYLPFFFVGIFCYKHGFGFPKKPLYTLLSCLCLLLFLQVYQIPHISMVLSNVLGILTVVSLCKIYISLKDNFNSKYLLNLDKCGMGIYIIHHILIMLLLQHRSFCELMDTHYLIMPIILFILVFPVSWFLAYCILKIKCLKFILG